MKGNRLVIPVSMRLDVLDKLNEGHQGITKSRERERDKTSVWWPGLSKQAQTTRGTGEQLALCMT